MEGESKGVRVALMQSVSLLAAEASRITAAFASHQNLHETDVKALALLRTAEQEGTPLIAGTIGAELGLTSGATTFMLNRLERSGLVRRVRDQSDQRRVLLHFTEPGRQLADQLVSPVTLLSNEVMDRFSLEELEITQRFLASTVKAMAVYRETLAGRPR